MSQKEFERGFLREVISQQDQPKQRHTAARKTFLTDGQEDHYELESEV